MGNVFKSPWFWGFIFLLFGGAPLITQIVAQTIQSIRAIPYQIQTGSPSSFGGGGFLGGYGSYSPCQPYFYQQPNYQMGGWGGMPPQWNGDMGWGGFQQTQCGLWQQQPRCPPQMPWLQPQPFLGFPRRCRSQWW
ncbi:MAG: hypothetical protein FJY91_01685 [Candidatus Harrisonbacteria bacterium]|nr:hypothetical protein [Candidatus Harrisonbacteria bacterium]